MNNNSLIMNGFQQVDDDLNIPEAHPILVVGFGTTMAELLVMLHALLKGISDVVPWLAVVVDSLTYEELVIRLVQNGYTEKQVQDAIPRSHYFHLTSPFSEDFDFNNPLNQAWLTTIFEPALQQLAAKPNAPGCAGTPALGRARVEGNEQDLREFFERCLRELTEVRTQTLALLPGVMVFVVTTYRGGTGTGATTTGSAVLQSVLDNGSSIHLHVVMPCVYTGDERTYANASAMLRENQHYHRFEGNVPMKGGRSLKPPFGSATYLFGSNGAVTLSHRDALMQEASILRSYLRAPTQGAINARHVDLVDVIPYDFEDKPMHVRVETAASLRTMQPGIQDYLATEWLRQELVVAQERFEAWLDTGILTTEEESRVNAVVENIIKVRSLSLNALLGRLEASPTPTNALRAFFEQINATIGSMNADAIKQNTPGLPQQVKDAFSKFEWAWKEGALRLTSALPREITDDVRSQLADSPYLASAALSTLCNHVAEIAKTATKEVENEKKKRDAAGAQVGPALNAVQGAGGLLGFINANEVVRNAAHQASSVIMAAAFARAGQQSRECVVQVLESGMTSLDSRGKSVSISSVTAALGILQVEQMAEVRKHYALQLESLRGRLGDLGQQIEKRSPVFQRALLYDGVTREKLDAMVQEMRKGHPVAPPIVKFLEADPSQAQEDLMQTLEELLLLLPTYVESQKSLTDILTQDPAQLHLAVTLLRNLKPFTPLDQDVENQQGLKNRRDTLVILEVPGGQNGTLANLFLREGIVTNRNQVVNSGEDEIRLYYLRDGLPYAAIRPLARYKKRHDDYLGAFAPITPYTVSGADQYPGMEPSRTNLRFHVEELLYTARAVLPNRVTPKPSGGFTLHYDQETDQGFTVPAEETFVDFDSMVRWLAKRVKTRKALEAELKGHLDADPDAYKASLVRAWGQAPGVEKDRLQQTLYRLKINPHTFVCTPKQKTPNAKQSSKQKMSNSKQKGSKKSKKS